MLLPLALIIANINEKHKHFGIPPKIPHLFRKLVNALNISRNLSPTQSFGSGRICWAKWVQAQENGQNGALTFPRESGNYALFAPLVDSKSIAISALI